MKTLQETMKCLIQAEIDLGAIYERMEEHRTYDNQEQFVSFKDWKDTPDQCVDMAQCQVLEAWTHTIKARQRLEKLQQAELVRLLETTPTSNERPSVAWINKIIEEQFGEQK